MDAGNEILANAKKKIAVTSAGEDVIVTAAKKKVRLHALEDEGQFTAKKALTVASTEDSVFARAKNTVGLQGKNIQTKGTSGTTIDDDQRVVVKGGSGITLESVSISVRGKVYLG